MFLYNTEILEEGSNISNSSSFYFKKNQNLAINSSYILRLNNNQHRQVAITSDKSLSNPMKNQQINFLVKDVVTFSSLYGSKIIEYKLHKEGNKELMNYWLIHTYLPILFTVENKYYFLHAGAVEIDNMPVLFIANSYGGKSTLTNYFIEKGHTFISDDKVGVFLDNDKVKCVSSYPYHRPYRKTEDLGIATKNFSTKVKEIGFIFNLVKSEETSKIEFGLLSGIEKFKVLRLSSDIDLFINKEERFKVISALANNTFIYNVTIPWNINRLNEVYEKINSFIKKETNGS